MLWENNNSNNSNSKGNSKVSKVLDVSDTSHTMYSMDKVPFLRRNLTIRTRKKKQQPQQQPEEQEILYIELTMDASHVHVVKSWAMFDFRCPFCGYLKKDRDHLVKHLRRFHKDHHTFSTSQRENGTFSIYAHPLWMKTIDIDSVKDYQFCRVPSSSQPPSASSSNFHFSCRRRVQPLTIDFASKTLQRNRRPGFSEPFRQYYHSRSRIPMEQPHGWDIDSDDESDDGWIDDLGQSCLNEFVDVTELEKRFINLWKRYIRSDTIMADGDVPQRCVDFVQTNAHQLQGLRMQWMMHLLTLWEYQLIPSSHIARCMTDYDALVGQYRRPMVTGKKRNGERDDSDDDMDVELNGQEDELAGSSHHSRHHRVL